MENCKDNVEITAHAAVLDVTPEETSAGLADGGGQSATAEPAALGEVSAVASEAAPADPALVTAGEAVFKKCRACHQVGEAAKHRVGPHLNGLIGRAAASAEGYKYSKAMLASGADGLIWTPDTISAFLEAPKKYVPKTKMSFKGLGSESDRAAIIAYLRQFHE